MNNKNQIFLNFNVAANYNEEVTAETNRDGKEWIFLKSSQLVFGMGWGSLMTNLPSISDLSYLNATNYGFFFREQPLANLFPLHLSYFNYSLIILHEKYRV